MSPDRHTHRVVAAWRRRSAVERGAILPIFALMLTTLTLSASFSVDIGRLTSTKRDLQSVVDLVALDAARVIDGRSAAELYPPVDAAAAESALRNDFVADELQALDVTLGVWDSSEREFASLEETSAATPNAVRVVAGSDVEFLFSSFDFRTSRQATAVRRIPGATPPYEGGPCVPGSPGCEPPCDPAVETCLPGCPASDPACSDPCETLPCDHETGCPDGNPECDKPCDPADPACIPGCPENNPSCCPPGDPGCPDPTEEFGSWSAFSLGSFLAGFEGSLPPALIVQREQKVGFLNVTVDAYVGLPGTSWNVSSVGYEGLAAADVTLDQLRIAGGFASVDELLEAEMTFAELAALTATALSNEPGGGTSAEAMGALAVAATATSTTQFKLGELVKVHQGMGGSAAGVELNVLETIVSGAMLSAAADIADGGSFLSMPISTAIPGVSTSTLKLAVIEAPVTAIGPAGTDSSGDWYTRAETAQIRAQIDTVFSNPSATGFLPTTQFSIPIVLDGADATGVLAQIRCMPKEEDTETVIGVDVDALRAHIGIASSLTAGAFTVGEATIVNDITGQTKGTSHVVVPGVSEDLSFFGPYNYDKWTEVSGSSTPSTVGVQLDTALTVSPVLKQAALQAALLPYLTPFDQLVLQPLAEALGLQIAGARTTAFDVYCGPPELVD